MRAEHARLHAARVGRGVLEHAAAARRVNEPGGVGRELGDEAEARERRKGDEATKPPASICVRRSTSCTGCRSRRSAKAAAAAAQNGSRVRPQTSAAASASGRYRRASAARRRRPAAAVTRMIPGSDVNGCPSHKIPSHHNHIFVLYNRRSSRPAHGTEATSKGGARPSGEF